MVERALKWLLPALVVAETLLVWAKSSEPARRRARRGRDRGVATPRGCETAFCRDTPLSEGAT